MSGVHRHSLVRCIPARELVIDGVARSERINVIDAELRPVGAGPAAVEQIVISELRIDRTNWMKTKRALARRRD